MGIIGGSGAAPGAKRTGPVVVSSGFAEPEPGTGWIPPSTTVYTTTSSPGSVAGHCPACGWLTLFLAAGGHVTCARLGCPRPTAADELLADPAVELRPGTVVRLPGPEVLYVVDRGLHTAGAKATLTFTTVDGLDWDVDRSATPPEEP